MLVELGNPAPVQKPAIAPDAPVVTYASIPEGVDANGVPLYGVDPSVDLAAVRDHYQITPPGEPGMNPDGVTHLPGHEALIALTHPILGIIANHGTAPPSWVWSEHDELARQIAEFHGGIPIGRPDGLEDTHTTLAGPPGVIPAAASPLAMATVNAGIDMMWLGLFAGAAQAGVGSTLTAATATTATGAAGMGTTKYIGAVIVVASATTTAFGVILSHTDTVLTIDRWYNPASRGGAVATTPGNTDKYVIMPATGPADFMALSATAGATVGNETTLAGEITTGGGGLIRKICPVAHSAGASTGTLTPVFTANGSDTLPVTLASIGVFNSLISGQLRYRTLFGTTATLSLSGDQATATDTITLT